MIHNPTRHRRLLLSRADLARPGSLQRDRLLVAASNALDAARALDDSASRLRLDARTGALLRRLDSQREQVATRAANVALAETVTASELQQLRDAARELVARRGQAARALGLVGQLS